MRLSTKARTLASLLGHLQTAKVADLVFFTVHDWKRSKDWCLSTIQEKIAGDLYIVDRAVGWKMATVTLMRVSFFPYQMLFFEFAGVN